MQFIKNAKHWYRLWSIQLNALGVSLLSFWLAYAAEISAWWQANATHLTFIEPDIIKWIGLFLVVSANFARIVKQEKLKSEK